MRRLAAGFCLWAGAAQAWEFSATPICTLLHDDNAFTLRVPYDATLPEYRLVLSLRDAPWPGGPTFAITFDGDRPIAIATDRHALSESNTTVSVTDRGFGNVLNGMEFNRTAIATLGDRQVAISLDGAAEPVRQFRACPAPGLV